MLSVVGIGPGSRRNMSQRAIDTINKSDTIVGYRTYMDLIEEFTEGKEVVSTGMRGEVERCQKAIEIAEEGKNVAVISSGDTGIYGMAGLIFELLVSEGKELDVEIIPGITASIAGASQLGAPLMNDFCHISLSDLMTPWEMIEKRLHAAAEGDFVICLYNPRSSGRPNHLRTALNIIKSYKGGDIYLGICKDIDRDGEEMIITTIDDFTTEIEEQVDMTTTVIVGNKFTKQYNNYLYTPRGYSL